MNNVSIVIKNKRYFIMPEIINDIGGTTPIDFIVSGTYNENSLSEDIGRDILKCMSAALEYNKIPGWDDPENLDDALRALGYKNYDDLRRGAKYLYVDTADNKLVFYPTKRHGDRSPSFEGIGEVAASSSSAKDISIAFNKAISLSS